MTGSGEARTYTDVEADLQVRLPGDGLNGPFLDVPAK